MPKVTIDKASKKPLPDDTKQRIKQNYITKELLISIAKTKTTHALTIIHRSFLQIPLKKIIVYTLLGIGILLIVTPIGTYIYFVRDFSSKENIINRKNAGIILLDRSNKPFFTFYEAQSRKIASISAIPSSVKNAVIAVEDKDFYQHPGFSLRSIGRAVVADVKREGLSEGGSTISQQLIKNTLLNQNKSFLRKYQELVLALELERRFSKNDILEMYLNTVYFGEGAFGIEEAAHTYFNKTSSQLTIAEAALLAGILPAPSAYSPLSGNKTAAFQRQRIVLSLMEQQKLITHTEALQAENTEIVFHPQTSELNEIAPHFALMVKDELIKKYGEQTVATSGFVVTTTLDLEAQQYAETTVQKQVIRLQPNKVTNGAAVIINPKTGAIQALVGSYNWNDEQNGKINMVTHPRQPGSSFKPFIYAKAFEEHLLTPGSILDDKQIEFSDGYKPKNYDGKFRGPVTVRRALANSLNIPAVEALQKISIASGIEMAQRLGVTTLKNPSAYGLSLVLGSAEIPLLEMTEGYSVFANGGIKNQPYTIQEIKDKNGQVLFTHTLSPRASLATDVSYLISSILSDNTARAEEFGNLLTISRPAAVKTGTTENYRDSLTIGYTPSVTVGVWVGNNDNTEMDNIAGSIGAAPIWRLLMEHMLKGTPIQRFIKPANVAKLMICKENGLKTTVATSSAYEEFFIKGTEPDKDCGLNPTPSITTTLSPTNQPDQITEPSNGISTTPNPTNSDQAPTSSVQVTPEPSVTIASPLPTLLPL